MVILHSIIIAGCLAGHVKAAPTTTSTIDFMEATFVEAVGFSSTLPKSVIQPVITPKLRQSANSRPTNLKPGQPTSASP